MTPEIKNRIEQIRRGEVPEGYKKTRAGIIPVEWQEKDLSDVLKKQTKKNADNSVNNVLTNSATRGIIRQTEYFDKQIANDENKEGYYIVKPGYFVYNPRISVGAPCGPFNKYYGETTGIMSPLYTVYKYADDSQYYSEFLSYYFNSSYWHKYMYGIANYGARSDRMNVTSDDMGSLPLPYPSLPEQKKIAEILAAQDRVIELYQRKIDEIKKLKKICLSKMFPQKGHNAPEIRFPEFTDAWEQRKLGDEFVRVNERNGGSFGINHWISVAKMYFQAPEKVTSNNLDTRTYVMRVGDIAFEGHSNAEFEFGRFVANDIGDGIISELFPIYRHKNEYYNPYWKYAIQIERIMRPVFAKAITSSGASSNKLNEEHFLRESILVPSLAEQVKIGDYFASLDNLITLNQRKLEELQKSKKALMQLLLTGIVRVNV